MRGNFNAAEGSEAAAGAIVHCSDRPIGDFRFEICKTSLAVFGRFNQQVVPVWSCGTVELQYKVCTAEKLYRSSSTTRCSLGRCPMWLTFSLHENKGGEKRIQMGAPAGGHEVIRELGGRT